MLYCTGATRADYRSQPLCELKTIDQALDGNAEYQPSSEGKQGHWAFEPGPPLLLVDIDGVISLFAFEAGAQLEGSFHSIDGIPHFLSSTAAAYLLGLTSIFELAWASGWEEKANEYLPHLLGLPELPYLSFERSPGRSNAHWKLDAIDAYAGSRPLAWIDDAFNDACHEWAQARPAPTLLVRTQPATGLTEIERATLLTFADVCRKQAADIRNSAN